MKIIVSACLLGCNCKYNGKNNYNSKVCELMKDHTLIPVCPEILGGLESPRIPCEKQADGTITGKNGEDFTAQFQAGAKKALEIALEEKADFAILQKRSPSCGSNEIYDGSFTGNLTSGDGLFAAALKSVNIPVLTADSENHS